MMRIAGLTLAVALTAFIHAPSSGQAEEGGMTAAADVARIFGHDPGPEKAYACFARAYDKAHLAGHPDQNVTQMTLFVSKPAGEEMQFNLGMQVRFRQLDKPFDVSGGCNLDREGRKALNCGIECDGGYLAVRVKNARSILVEIPESVRLWDPDAADSDELPDRARFGSDDKLFRLDRTDLKNCLPLIYDDEIRAEISR